VAPGAGRVELALGIAFRGLKLFFGRKQVELGQRRQGERGVGKDDGTAGIEENGGE
jgi:hypothetical protein